MLVPKKDLNGYLVPTNYINGDYVLGITSNAYAQRPKIPSKRLMASDSFDLGYASWQYHESISGEILPQFDLNTFL